MRPTRQECSLLLSSLLFLIGLRAQAQPPSADLLRARAEAPAEPRPVESGTARGAETTQQLFFMTGADNASCVRSVADVTGDGRDEIVAGIDESQTDKINLNLEEVRPWKDRIGPSRPASTS